LGRTALRFGRAADPDHRHAAGQLGEPLLKLLAVVVGGRLLDLLADLGAAAFDVLLGPGAVDDRGVLLLDRDLLGPADVPRGKAALSAKKCCVLELVY
jgi:hypothetical protein